MSFKEHWVRVSYVDCRAVWYRVGYSMSSLLLAALFMSGGGPGGGGCLCQGEV